MSKYNQPFCIIGSKGRFAKCYEEKRYLPPIEYDIVYQQMDANWEAVERRCRRYKLVEEDIVSEEKPRPRIPRRPAGVAL